MKDGSFENQLSMGLLHLRTQLCFVPYYLFKDFAWQRALEETPSSWEAE